MLRDDIRFLGTSGSKKSNQGSTCIQISDTILIDAGNIINTLSDEAQFIEHIFLTHSHLDHISDIAFLIDNVLLDRKKPLRIYGLKETLRVLREHIFNWDIWPDFQDIKLIKSSSNSIEFIEIEFGKSYHFPNLTLEPIELNHTVATCGYIIKKKSFKALYATDTYKCNLIWEIINSDKEIKHLIIDVSFPSNMEQLAKNSKHLTPLLLKEELEKLQRDDLSINIVHIKPNFYQDVVKEIEILGLLRNGGRILEDGDYLIDKAKRSIDQTQKVLEISTALSKEKDLSKILDLLLTKTMEHTKAEGGTIYIKRDDSIYFHTVKNYALNIFSNGKNFPKIELFPNGEANVKNASALCAIEKRIINIPDIYMYHMGAFNFDGAKKFDNSNNYRTRSMLVVPMLNQDNEVVGVMQLINKNVGSNYIPFTQDDIDITKTYANLSATAITKNRLIDELEELIISFLESISYAISVKSPYGYGHISRVKELMSAIINEINQDEKFFAKKRYSQAEIKEIELAAWMHDIGKIATPEHILDKSSRLEFLSDKVDVISLRVDLIKESLRADMFKSKYRALDEGYKIDLSSLDEGYEKIAKELDEDLEFIKWANLSSTTLNESDIKRVQEIAKKSFMIGGKSVKLLMEDEVEALSVRYGTLTKSERDKINEHALITLNMLKMITFPKKYSKVPSIAASHHEKLNGSGYPQGLKEVEISFEAQLLAIVDILEALTSMDRPYKRAKTKEETYAILDEMVEKGEINREIVSFIKEANIFEKYINKELKEKEVLV